VPVAIAVLVATWKFVPVHASEETHNNLDLPGAVSITAALMLLVYALVKAPTLGWTSSTSLQYFGLSALLIAFFIFNELSAKHPLVPLRIFRIRNVTAANLVQLPIIAGMFSTFFFITLYAQQVLGYSPVKTGLCFLAIPIVIAIAATNVPRVIQKIGFKPILVVGPLFVAAALFWFGRVRVDGNYLHDLLPGFILMGLGMGMNFIAITVAATSGVPARESGLASGILNTSQQIGGALGLAILTGIATSASLKYITDLHAVPDTAAKLAAQVQGFHTAFHVGACFMVAASVMALVLIKQKKVDPEAAAVMAH
jgi:predicted MFS family arabinose efflux permease